MAEPQRSNPDLPENAFHVGSFQSANVEYLPAYPGRGTGFMGTGLYVYLRRPSGSRGPVPLHTLPSPWARPWTLHTFDDFLVLNEFSRDMRDVFYRGTTVASVVESHSTFLRALLGPKTKTKMENLVCQALALSYATMARNPQRGIQPINFLMIHAGYDGIVNEPLDTNAQGSVVYKPNAWIPHTQDWDPWYERAMQMNDAVSVMCSYPRGSLQELLNPITPSKPLPEPSKRKGRLPKESKPKEAKEPGAPLKKRRV